MKWWLDNLKRPSTWIGIIFIVFFGSIFIYDYIIIHTLLMNIVSSPQITGLVVSGIGFGFGHFLIGYKKDSKDDSNPPSIDTE